MKILHYFLSLLILFPVMLSGSQGISHGTPEVKSENKKSGKSLIHWLSFEEAVKRNEKEPKKIFIDIYTDWCGWCKRMDITTFEDSATAKYMNEKFYAVKLDAETKDTIHFRGNNFVFVPENRVNQITLALMNNKMSGYPTSVYLDEKNDLLTTYAGYLAPQGLLPILKYFAENIYKNLTWEEYQKTLPAQEGVH